MRRRDWGTIGLMLATAGAALALDAQFDFMPAGGRTLLADLAAQTGGAGLAEIAAKDLSAEGWRDWAASQETGLTDAALDTVAAYAALNLPAGEDIIAALAESGDAMLLPPDGKDLAIAQCQFCHSLFSGYLMHDRDEVGWKGTFKAPFHAEIPMSEVERDTFAIYSAINMPMKFDDVPPELRF
ncbi:hypothetical protein SAMN05421759_11129 [Roseivivax lentus]|uniref:Cytochrome c domain-containing protein n=1 Tax=Roseivivax lentus TaxID=633194 RepID=A0A1N7NYF3_9RHOB|nr:hypothetical protein [Roseivivax lentus]SIT03344.1 hypothetical protein SAMN05421759_11129 [Roseivivax lentus]